VAAESSLNIALVLRRFGGSGGTEKYAHDFAGWLAAQGHEVHVYCAVASGPPVDVAVHRIGGDSLFSFWRASHSLPGHEQHDALMGFGRSHRHDIFRVGGGAHARWAQIRDQTALSRLRSAWSFREQFHLRTDRHACRNARWVVANSQMGARDVAEHYGVGMDQIRVIRNGVDCARFRFDEESRASARREWRVPEGGRVALFLGSGFQRKGLDTAIDAFDQASLAGDRLVVIGEDRHAPRWRERAHQRLGTRLVWAGPTARPEHWLCGADAMLLPTRYDPAANATIEALATGVPPVTTSRDGNGEIVPDPRLVVDVDAGVSAFASALRYAWSARADLHASCRATAEAWPVSRNGKSVVAILRQVVAERSG